MIPISVATTREKVKGAEREAKISTFRMTFVVGVLCAACHNTAANATPFARNKALLRHNIRGKPAEFNLGNDINGEDLHIGR